MEDEVKQEEPVKKVKLDLKYKRDSKLQTVKLFVKNQDNKCEAYLEEELGNRKKEDFEEESVTFIKSWFDLDQNLQRASTIFGMRDNSLYNKLLLMYRLKGLSFIPEDQWKKEKDDVGIKRMAPAFADELLGEDGLPVEIVNTILRAINAG